MEAEEEPWQDRDWIFLVVNMRDGSDGVMCVDIVSEFLVSDAGEAIAYEGDLRGGDMERDVDRVQERYGGACAETLFVSRRADLQRR